VKLAPPQEMAFDVVVVGGGGAGLRAAYEAARAGARTAMVTKGRIGVSGATAVGLAASAGFAVPDGAGDPLDTPEVHFNDIMTAAQGCADASLVRILVDEAVAAAADLDRWGIDFIRDPQSGKPLVAQGDFASRPRNRKIYHHGRPITVALKREIERLQVTIVEGATVLSLIQDASGVQGVYVVTRDGKPLVISAGATVLTTGGAGQLFRFSLMPPDITGDGYALGYKAGARLSNMEFMQAGFGIVKPALNIVDTWFWAAAPRFLDRNGEPVLPAVLPDGCSLADAMGKKVKHYPFSASDDSRWLEIGTKNAMRDGRADAVGAFQLDLRGCDPTRIPQKGFAQLWEVSKIWLKKKNIDIDAEPMRIGLFGHAINGGLVADAFGQTDVPGLFSAGENAAGPYGADRLGGNMLLSCQVFGRRTGQRAAEIGRARADQAARADAGAAVAHALAVGGGTRAPKTAHAEIKALMTEHMLVVRNAAGLARADAGLADLSQALGSGAFAAETPQELVDIHQAISLAEVGRMMCAAALLRKETRGSHYRDDAPQKDPAMAIPIEIVRGPSGPQASFVRAPAA
jgi:L-aspartate oxidase